MSVRSLDDLQFIAVLGDPPRYPWSPIASVVCEVPGEDCVFVTERIDQRSARGYPMPKAWLDAAIEDQIATRLDPPIAARGGHQLIRGTDGSYRLRHRDAVLEERNEESARRLTAALHALVAERNPETARDRFDDAYVVAPDEIVTVALRAGAAATTSDEDWIDEAIEDLVRVAEYHGVLLSNVRVRAMWRNLPYLVDRERLLERATIGLNNALAAPTELFPPVPTAVFDRAARIAGLWRTGGTGALGRISQRVLRAAISGDPAALNEAERSVAEQAG